MNEEDSQMLKLAKAAIGAGLLAKDNLTSAIKDVLVESDLGEEKRKRLEEKLIQRTEATLEDLEGSFQDKMEEGRQQVGLASKESVKDLENRVSRIEDRLSELESKSNYS